MGIQKSPVLGAFKNVNPSNFTVQSYLEANKLSQVIINSEENFGKFKRSSKVKRHPYASRDYLLQMQNWIKMYTPTYSEWKKLVILNPTEKKAFQLRSVLSNFAWLFSTSAKLSNFRLSNFSFFPTALFNYTHPDLRTYIP